MSPIREIRSYYAIENSLIESAGRRSSEAPAQVENDSFKASEPPVALIQRLPFSHTESSALPGAGSLKPTAEFQTAGSLIGGVAGSVVNIAGRNEQ
jgi:hypothetical protein